MSSPLIKYSAPFLIASGICFSQLAQAGSVEMLNTPSSAKEMGKALFAKPEKKRIKTRSISFGSKKPSTNTAEKAIEKQEQQVANSKPKTLGLPIKFAINSAQILPESMGFVQEIGKMLNFPEYSHEKVMIEGHTDASGSFDKNLILSYRRADAIKTYLMSNYNISADRLDINGRGEKEPLPGTDPNAAVNRRVQLYRK